MKRNILYVAIALFLLIGGEGCEKDNSIDYTDVNVVYQRCDNSADYTNGGEISIKDILLFNQAYIEECEIIKRYSQKEEIEYVIYDPNAISKEKFTYKKIRINSSGHVYGNFCNFPIDNLEKWYIPNSGLFISFSGDYVITKFTQDAISYTIDISLKSLKIQKLRKRFF